MTNDGSYYRLLGVENDASERDIRRAWRQRSRAVQPDRNTVDPASAEVLARINEAYATLRDPASRAAYDEGLGSTAVWTRPAASAAVAIPSVEGDRPLDARHAVTPAPRSSRTAIPMTRVAIIVLALVGTAFAMLLGYVEKRECNPPRVWNGFQYRHNCYNDMLPLYGPRNEPFHDKDRNTPFAKHGLAYRDNGLEYPSLTGLFISTVNAPVSENNPAGFLAANSLGLAIFALAGAAALAAIARRPSRLALYMFAPAMIAYAFHNWDLIPVGLLGVAFWAYTKEKDWLAGAMLGLGAAAKIFPGLIVPALLLARRREGKPLAPILVGSVIWFLIPNVIVLFYAGFDGWWFPWEFQSTRLPNFETASYFFLEHGQRWWPSKFWFSGDYARAAQMVTTALFFAGAGVLLWRESRRADFRPIATGFGIVIIFLLTAKVFSPQYALWLLPFFVLVRVPWHAFAAYAVGDIFVLIGVWAYFTAFADGTVAPWHLRFLEVTVYFRYATLGYLLYWTRRGEDLAGELAQKPDGPVGEAWATV